MAKYRKKPVIVEAMQFQSWNVTELCKWAGTVFAIRPGRDGEPEALYIPTLEGEMTAQLGDWIVIGVKGELYPVKPDIFEATYEQVDKMEEVNVCVSVGLDGNQWYALLGNNLQEGLSGFGDTPTQALRCLIDEMETADYDAYWQGQMIE